MGRSLRSSRFTAPRCESLDFTPRLVSLPAEPFLVSRSSETLIAATARRRAGSRPNGASATHVSSY
jgi:hypothetical protein